MINRVFILLTALTVLCDLNGQPHYDTSKPWTYWWWMGSAVNKEDIRQHLDDYSEAGLGGVHIIPIYGVKGYEDQFIHFLSEEWMEMVAFTMEEAKKRNLGVDMTLGTGWPCGGEMIPAAYAAKKLKIIEIPIGQKERITFIPEKLTEQNELLDLIAAYAGNESDRIDLTGYLERDVVSQQVPRADWKLTLFGLAQTGQQVKRAAPGGEGRVLDYFDSESVHHYLNHFDSVFTHSVHSVQPRAIYHDSYEVYNANWTSQFTCVFRDLRGYDILQHLPVLQDTSHELYPPIIHDIRTTISELLYTEFTTTWTDWCAGRNSLSRNQAHGSPSNILDLYGLADIPETESFGCSDLSIPGLACDPDYRANKFGRPSPLMMKFVSSAAHVLGKLLVSSETATWLANHFKVSLRRIKPQVDELFVSGINHIFYHGITYSPEEEGFPGWLFYASTNFGKQSHFWEELPLLNGYIENCQNLLQEADPDNDILLYFPISDLSTKYRDKDIEDFLLLLDVHHYDKWFNATPFRKSARLLWNNGYAFDYVSDRQINLLKVDGDSAASISGKSKYRTMVVPAVDYIPEATMEAMESLAGEGFRIIFADHLPAYYAGLPADQELGDGDPTERIFYEDHDFIISHRLPDDVDALGIRHEEIKKKGIDFIRKKNDLGKVYFLTNLSNRYEQDSVSLADRYNYVTITDPLTGKEGYIETRDRFLLEIPPGKSVMIQTSLQKPAGEKWHTHHPCDTMILNGPWSVSFTGWDSHKLKDVYRIDTPEREAQRYIMEIEDVRETARVRINGTECGTIWSSPNRLELPPEILKAHNQIEIIVQNLSANYMIRYDQEHPEWKKFYDINFVDIRYDSFSTRDWQPEPSGIIGEVRLISLK